MSESSAASKEHKEKGFAGEKIEQDKKYGITFQEARGMVSRIKDVKNVWIKDTLMNIVLSSVKAEDLPTIKTILSGEEFKKKLKTIETFLTSLGKNEEIINKTMETLTGAVNQVTEQVEKAIKSDQENKKMPVFGNDKQSEFMEYDSTLIGARQDTYIPFDKVQLRNIWQQRLHVVESREDSDLFIDRLGQYEKGYVKVAIKSWNDLIENLSDDKKEPIKKSLIYNDFVYQTEQEGYSDNPKEMTRLIADFEKKRETMVQQGKLFMVKERIDSAGKNTRQAEGVTQIYEELSNLVKVSFSATNAITRIKDIIKNRQKKRITLTRSKETSELYNNIGKILQ